jgi:hypothetical protein
VTLRVTSAIVLGPGGTMYFQSDDSLNRYAFNALNPDGTLRWKFPLNAFIDNTSAWKAYSRPLVDSDSIIYINSLDGGLYAIKPDGHLKWKFMPPERVRTCGLNIGLDGTLYFVSTNGTLYAMDRNGNVKWTSFIDNGFFGYEGGPQLLISPDGKTLYTGKRDGNGLYALDLNGIKKWFYPYVSNTHYSSRCIDVQGNIYSNFGDTLVSLAQDGIPRWKVKKGSGVTGISIDWNGNIYFCSQNIEKDYKWSIYSVDWNGNHRWEYILGTWFSVHLIIDGNNTIYGGEGSIDKLFIALNDDGTLKWSCRFENNCDILSCPAIGSDGKIYLPSGSTSPNTLFGVFIID